MTIFKQLNDYFIPKTKPEIQGAIYGVIAGAGWIIIIAILSIGFGLILGGN